jgi:hypothetical protein
MKPELIPSALVDWRYRELNPDVSPDCVLCFRFGILPNGEPGRSNIAIAEQAKRHRELPIFAQEPIVNLLQDRAPNLTTITPQDDSRFDTHKICCSFHRLARGQGFRRPLIISNPLHFWRPVNCLKRLGYQPVLTRENLEIPLDRESTEWWTRNLLEWYLMEAPDRLRYILMGWV